MNPWGHLKDRYESVRPRKMLALDGGGIRGALTLEVLIGIEDQLKKALGAGESFRLCDFFDYVGGTSTGAIIAAGVARGMSARELLAFYVDAGEKMFEKRWLLLRLNSIYKSDPLAKQLKKTFGAKTTLEPEHLKCLLLVVTRNRTTDSPWPISSNPLAMYNDPKRPDCNLRIPLWQLVRASTAAPVFFPPEIVPWDKKDPNKTFVFVDGGVTPYNNPAFLMYRMATVPEYRLGWKTGEKNLMLISVGTGASPTIQEEIAGETNVLSNVSGLPSALMYGAAVDQDINCRTLGRCVAGDAIDGEIGDLIPRGANGRRLPLSRGQRKAFLYARYNAELSEKGLARLGLEDIDPEKVNSLDSVDAIDDLRRVGRAVASQVDMTDFGPFVR